MVEAFVGLVGGGKSYNSVRRMCNYIGNGGRVVTNILFTGYNIETKEFDTTAPIFPYLVKHYQWQYQPGQYQYISFDEMCTLPGWFYRVPGGADRDHRTFLCIDESTDLFDNLDRGKLSSDSVYRDLFKFLRLSRHAHIDVLFICQDLNAINSRLRGLVSFIWRSTDLKTFRIGGLKMALPINCFLLQQFERTGKMEVRREFIPKETEIFDMYESEAFHDKLGITFATRVKRVQLKGVKRMTPLQKLALAVCFILGLVALLKVQQYTDDIKAELKELKQTIEAVPKTTQVASGSDPQQNNATTFTIPKRNIVRGEFRYTETPRQNYCYVDGALFRPGLMTEYGVCRIVSKDMIICVDGLQETCILPSAPGSVPASAVSLQGVRDGPGAL